ncbi:FAD-binding and (Fe-S)-binding domain-containing protein [Desulfolutivibrio sulfoxidireducens]|uniref:FAD-binding and (Fe-S)-binding domain-containing protein n=1 Tax=Desulfolutivibrio sulfoxidireducens TaxID=2773299 RepID=UPI00159DDAD4|nr:FAD-binding and (Fe-S)-binding domain-containing protein [Desulfolutivibrio sulfoxidireducens]QLA20675.1 FAD-binding protein [Desulfolutivibrio sulfoxidireducens]
MLEKNPHISLSLDRLVPRVLGITPEELSSWPDDARELAVSLAAECFLVRYNPFVNPEEVRQGVAARLDAARPTAWGDYPGTLRAAVARFWKDYDADMRFKERVLMRLSEFLPDECLAQHTGSLVECSTDATDLRMELPMLVLTPISTEHVQGIVRLAGEMGFAVVPRGGGSGLTGGAIPARRRSVILSMSRMKAITAVDVEKKLLCAQTGVITLTAITAAAKHNLLLTVDPASKAASSLGGNIAENAGGPFCFEYGTTLDNIHSYTMVLPDARVIEVRRRDHPRHKILPEETAVFDIHDQAGTLTETISLQGGEIRGPGLGKDVSNKYLGGLPGVQKEGVDGIVTEACFILHDRLPHSRVLCLEFFGRSMRHAMLVIKDVVGLRDRIRLEGDAVKISALEEFGSKYVRAINYAKKSATYEGEPISVLLLQLDSADEQALDAAVANIVDIATPYENVDIFVAENDKQAEVFWEDRHKLSAISKRTSGFKINEDIVIPLGVVPEFSDFIEGLNLRCLGRAYKEALQNASRLHGVSPSDEFLAMEMEFADRILRGGLSAKDLSDAEVEVQTYYFFSDLTSRYPRLREPLREIYNDMIATRIEVANHMHAGDGNCHVNIPVNSNDQEMMRRAMEAADEVFTKVMSLGGAVSGEHGIGITKIAFLEDKKIAALRRYKAVVDPKNIFNPGKLVTKTLDVEPYTFSFNRLIRDIKKTALPEKDRLIAMLANIQFCNRCGKCKQVCPMYAPSQGLLYHPRNKNISLGALIEAIHYSQLRSGEPDPGLLDRLRRLMEHCTACGKCAAACPVKIQSAQVALDMRAYLETKEAGGHPIKTRVLSYLARDPSVRLPTAAKLMAYGQAFHGRAMGLVPAAWRNRLYNPVLRGPNPAIGVKNLAEKLRLEKGCLFSPPEAAPDAATVLYFPGCGAGLFSPGIGMAAVELLLRAGVRVVIPPAHLCCGYPLAVSGLAEAFATNRERTLAALRKLLEAARDKGFLPATLLTACGTCREALEGYDLAGSDGPMTRRDVLQFLAERLPPASSPDGRILYHAACHAEWAGVPALKVPEAYRAALAALTGAAVSVSPGCCGESGLGALTSPEIHNRIRAGKTGTLQKELADDAMPVVVGCPSCRIGIARCLGEIGRKNRVLHALEYLAALYGGPKWKRDLKKRLKAARVRL